MCNNNPYILVLGASIVDIIGFSRKNIMKETQYQGILKYL